MLLMNMPFREAVLSSGLNRVFPDRGWRCEVYTGRHTKNRVDPDKEPDPDKLLAACDHISFYYSYARSAWVKDGGSHTFQNIAPDTAEITWFRMVHKRTGFVLTGIVRDIKSRKKRSADLIVLMAVAGGRKDAPQFYLDNMILKGD